MKISKTFIKLSTDYWAILPHYHQQLSQLINDHTSKLFSKDYAGILEKMTEVIEEKKCYEINNNIGIINIEGALDTKVGKIEKMMGFIGIEEINEALDKMEEDPECKAIFFNVDSPGGSVNGIPELAERIKKINKPKCAYTNSLCASAAYWISSQCDLIYCSKSAQVGSVGVYQSILDISKMYDNMGVKVELIKSGKNKGIGIPGISINEDQRNLLQDNVNKIYNMFKTDVLNERNINDENLDGRVVMGIEAKKNGMVDDIMDFDDAMEMLKEMIPENEESSEE